MSDGITIRITGLPRALAKIDAAIRNIGNTASLHDAIGHALVSRVVQGFDLSTGPYGKWRDLVDSTIARRRKRSKKPLLDSQRLRGSITHEFDQRSVRVGTNVEYAQYHQFGTRTIPRRAFLPDRGLPKQWEQEDVVDTVEAFLSQGL